MNASQGQEQAIAYLNQVKSLLNEDKYKEFLSIMTDFKASR
jgi:histone deacetylase complex regulatory component SIN3